MDTRFDFKKINPKIEKILDEIKGKKVGVFIDDANWFYPLKELGWYISFQKLKKFLARFCNLKYLRLYAGTPADSHNREKFNQFSFSIKKSGYETITKPLKKIYTDDKKIKFIYKANFDVEIAFDIARLIDNVDVIVVGSGDSDFLEAKNFSLQHKKKFFFLCFEKGVAWEIRHQRHIFIEELKDKIKQ